MYYILITYCIVDAFSSSKKYYSNEIYFLDTKTECDFLISKRKYELETKYYNKNCLYLEQFKSEINEVIKSKINYV